MSGPIGEVPGADLWTKLVQKNPETGWHEARRFFHGTNVKEQFNVFRESPESAAAFETKPIDQLIGPHFATDSTVANRFASAFFSDAMWTEELKNAIPNTGIHHRPRVYVSYIVSKKPRVVDSYNGHDSHGLSKDVVDVVFGEGGGKGVFVNWIKRKAGWVDPEELYNSLRRGRYPEYSSVSEYITAKNPQMWGMDRKSIIRLYKAKLKQQGYDSIVYENTAKKEIMGLAKSQRKTVIPLDAKHIIPAYTARRTRNMLPALVGGAGILKAYSVGVDQKE